jgi:hypothetical protein
MQLGPGVRAYRFVGPRGRVTVAWTEAGERAVVLPVSGSRVTVVERDGSSHERMARAGGVRLGLTGSPVFIREGL